MADRTFASLVPRIAPSAPQCPNKTIEYYIRDAAIQVCERTLAWRYLPPKFDLLPGVHEYVYEKPDNAEVHAVFAALVNDCPLDNLTLDQAICKHPEWADLYSGEDPSVLWSETPGGAFGDFVYNDELFNGGSEFVLPDAVVAKASSPVTICQITPNKYIVLPLPNEQQYTMRMFLALKPKRDATGMDEVAFNELEDVILHRTLQNLLILPNVPWADRELATYHAKQYVFHVGERRARANLGNARGSMHVRPVPFA